MVNLSDWLIKELRDRGWSQRELARRSGISQTQISNVINDQANAGADFCLSIARPLHYNPEDIMRMAGLLPSLPPAVAEEDEVIRIFRNLPTRLRDAAIAMLRGLSSNGHPSIPAQTIAEERSTYHPPTPLNDTILELFDRLPTHHQDDLLRYAEQLAREQTDHATSNQSHPARSPPP
jgi:transcriptional regulator with XRE-family HTH domain